MINRIEHPPPQRTAGERYMFCIHSTMGAGCMPGCLHDDQDALATQATKITLLSMFHIATLAGRKEFPIPTTPTSNLLSLASHLGHCE